MGNVVSTDLNMSIMNSELHRRYCDMNEKKKSRNMFGEAMSNKSATERCVELVENLRNPPPKAIASHENTQRSNDVGPFLLVAGKALVATFFSPHVDCSYQPKSLFDSRSYYWKPAVNAWPLDLKNFIDYRSQCGYNCESLVPISDACLIHALNTKTNCESITSRSQKPV